MTARVVFTESARVDLRRIAEYIAADNPKRARSFVAELRSRPEAKLSVFPASGPAVGIYRYTFSAITWQSTRYKKIWAQFASSWRRKATVTGGR